MMDGVPVRRFFKMPYASHAGTSPGSKQWRISFLALICEAKRIADGDHPVADTRRRVREL